MKKRLLAVVLCLTMLLAVLTVSALANGPTVEAYGTCGENLMWELYDNGELSISGTGKMNSYYGFSPPWHDYLMEVTNVNIYNGVESIGDFAFAGCSNLTHVTIPDSVDEIGMYAFSSCSSLVDVTIPDGVTRIPNAAFSACDALERVYIPASVTEIVENGFYGSDSLTDIYYGGTEAQWNSIDIDWSNVMYENLLNAEKHFNITDWGYCGASGYDVHWMLDSAGTLTISGSGKMDDYMTGSWVPWKDHFDDIKSVVILDGVTQIGYLAFETCSNLTTVTIPYSVTLIYEAAFRDCTGLTDVYYYGTENDWSNIYIGKSDDEELNNATKHYLGVVGSCGANLTWKLDDDGTLTISGTGAMYDYDDRELPWDARRDDIKNVIIEDDVTSIGAFAFEDCRNLTYVRIPESVTTIGIYAFAGDSSLTSVRIPSQVTKIPWAAFDHCTGLKNLIIAGTLAEIKSDAFSCCDSLEQVYYAGTNRNVFYDAAAGTSLLPSTCNIYTSRASGYCGDTMTWVLEDNGTLIISGTGYMDNYYNVVTPWSAYYKDVQTIFIEDGVESIGNHAFASFFNLTSVRIPDSVEEIGGYAFCNCYSLTEVTIPEHVTQIPDAAFADCKALKRIYIPAGVTKIGQVAFTNCDSLTSVYYGGTEAQWSSIDIYNSDAKNDILINVEKKYQVTAWGHCGDSMVWTLDTAGTLTISGSYIMASYSQGTTPWYAMKDDIKTVIIEDGVTIIGTYAFADCTNLTFVKLPESVVAIYGYAFDNCSSLKSVRIPSQVMGLTWGTFENCTSLEKLIIAGTDFSISSDALVGCDSLREVYYTGTDRNDFYDTATGASLLPASCHNIYTSCASGYCGDTMTWVWAPEQDSTLWILGSGEMYGYDTDYCAPWYNYRKSVVILRVEDGITGIGSEAFMDCTNMKYALMPDSVAKIGTDAFSECSSLADVKIPAGVTEIHERTFYDCEHLTQIYIPGSVAAIDKDAFWNCESLTEVCYEGSKEAWDGISIDNTGSGNSYVIYADKHFSTIDCGTCGLDGASNATWALNATGTLTICGLMKMNYYPVGSAPWVHYYSEIKSLVINEMITDIGMGDFYGCSKLTQVEIPESVSVVGESAFEDCNSLTDVYYEGTRAQWDAITIGDYNDALKNATIHCTDDPVIDFEDVQDTDAYYYEPVIWAAANGIVYGVDDTHFAPEATCNRAQVVTFLYRAAGEPTVTGKNPFADVKADDYYYDAVLWGYQNGIVYGTDDTHFSPDADVTRAQFITFLHRFAHEPAPTITTSPFTDVPAGAYYIDAVLWGYENEIVYGTDEDKFSPDASCTRGQVVTFLYRYLTK